MATQTDVQQLIQSLVPSGVNNGNPNTVYNVPPPSLNAQGQWAQGLLPQAASIGGLNLPAILAQLPAPTWGSGPVAGAPVGPILPSFPPPGGGGGGGGGTGGFVPPTLPPQTPPQPVLPPGGGGTTTGGTGVLEPIRDVHTGILQQGQTLPGTWTDPYTGGFGTVGPWAGGITGSLGGAGGGGSLGGWQVGLDKLANLFDIDPYLQGTGQWNFKGALSDILHQIVGVPGGTGSFLSELTGFGPGQNFYDQQLMRKFEDKKGQTMDKMFQKTLQGLQDETLAKYGIDPKEKAAGPKMTGGGRDSRSAAGAGSTTIAEDAAAQQMVADWQAAQREALMKALAQGAMNPRHSLES